MNVTLSRRMLLALGAAVFVVGLIAGIGLGAALFLRYVGPADAISRTNGSGIADSKPGELQSPFLKKFADGLPNDSLSGDLSPADRDQARQILREADPLLERVKRENQKALESLRKPQQIPNRPAAEEPPRPREGRI